MRKHKFTKWVCDQKRSAGLVFAVTHPEDNRFEANVALSYTPQSGAEEDTPTSWSVWFGGNLTGEHVGDGESVNIGQAEVDAYAAAEEFRHRRHLCQCDWSLIEP
jgi:hypothetical protein